MSTNYVSISFSTPLGTLLLAYPSEEAGSMPLSDLKEAKQAQSVVAYDSEVDALSAYERLLSERFVTILTNQ